MMTNIRGTTNIEMKNLAMEELIWEEDIKIVSMILLKVVIFSEEWFHFGRKNKLYRDGMWREGSGGGG